MIGFWEIAFLVLLVILIIFIPSKLPEIMRNLAKAIKEFKSVMKETEEVSTEVKKSLSTKSEKKEE